MRWHLPPVHEGIWREMYQIHHTCRKGDVSARMLTQQDTSTDAERTSTDGDTSLTGAWCASVCRKAADLRPPSTPNPKKATYSSQITSIYSVGSKTITIHPNNCSCSSCDDRRLGISDTEQYMTTRRARYSCGFAGFVPRSDNGEHVICQYYRSDLSQVGV